MGKFRFLISVVVVVRRFNSIVLSLLFGVSGRNVVFGVVVCQDVDRFSFYQKNNSYILLFCCSFECCVANEPRTVQSVASYCSMNGVVTFRIR